MSWETQQGIIELSIKVTEKRSAREELVATLAKREKEAARLLVEIGKMREAMTAGIPEKNAIKWKVKKDIADIKFGVLQKHFEGQKAKQEEHTKKLIRLRQKLLEHQSDEVRLRLERDPVKAGSELERRKRILATEADVFAVKAASLRNELRSAQRRESERKKREEEEVKMVTALKLAWEKESRFPNSYEEAVWLKEEIEQKQTLVERLKDVKLTLDRKY